MAFEINWIAKGDQLKSWIVTVYVANNGLLIANDFSKCCKLVIVVAQCQKKNIVGAERLAKRANFHFYKSQNWLEANVRFCMGSNLFQNAI